MTTAQTFDPERLDVYRLSIEYVARSLEASQSLEGFISTLECAAFQDVLVTTNGIQVQDDAAMKALLHRIVVMLTRMAMKFDGVGESSVEYNSDIDYDNEHRCAEHEHESQTRETPELWR
jgi:hypothetical protein